MSRFNTSVSVPLDDLCDMKQSADLYDFMKETSEANDRKYRKTVEDLEARLAEANNAAGKLRKELDKKAAIAPEAFPKMSEDLAQSFDRATKAINDAENPPPLIATPNREMILGVLKDIVHNVAVYFTKPQTTEEEPF